MSNARLSLRRTGLLGRSGRNTVNLPRITRDDFDVENQFSRSCEDDQGIRFCHFTLPSHLVDREPLFAAAAIKNGRDL